MVNLMDPVDGLDETSSKYRVARVLAHALHQMVADGFTLMEAKEIWEACADRSETFTADMWDRFLGEIRIRA